MASPSKSVFINNASSILDTSAMTSCKLPPITLFVKFELENTLWIRTSSSLTFELNSTFLSSFATSVTILP